MQIILTHIKKMWEILCEVSLLKSIWFNIHYFPFNIAIRLPVFIYRHTSVSIGGRIDGGNLLKKTGLIRIGAPHVGFINSRYNRTIWHQKGTLIVHGPCEFGSGCKVCIGKNALLSIGSHFMISGGTTIICEKSIYFGDDCLLSWEIQLLDTDYHTIRDEKGVITNHPKEIRIENHVWIGSRSTILKGTYINSGCIVASGSIVSGHLNKEKTVYACQGKIIKELKNSITWE